MPIDSSIYFQQQTPDFLGSYQRGLALRGQMDQRAKQQDMKEAYKQSMVETPGGGMQVDPSKLSEHLAGKGYGQEAMKIQQYQQTRQDQQAKLQQAQKMQQQKFGLEERKLVQQDRLKEKELAFNERKQQRQAEKVAKLNPDKILKVQEGVAIPSMLQDLSGVLEQNKDQFGPIAGRMGAMNPYDELPQTIDSKVRASSQAFGRFMEGGVLRKEDEEKYRKMFPNLQDTPNVAKNKLAIVNRQLVRRLKSDVAALKKGGYDVSPFNEAMSMKTPEDPRILSQRPDGSNSFLGGVENANASNIGRTYRTNEIEWAD